MQNRFISDLFSDIISFQHVSHFGVGIRQIEWKLKVKMKFQFFQIGQNDRSNSYIESTTVLSDNIISVCIPLGLSFSTYLLDCLSARRFFVLNTRHLSLLVSVSSVLQSLIDCQPNTAWKSH